MKPIFIKKNGTVSKVSGIIMNLIPSYTLAEYNALTHKPLLWVRTDEEYAQIPSEDVSYGSGSVEDALDSLTASMAKTFVELGSQNGIGGAWDALTVYDRPVLCAWTKNGRYWGLLYKYTGGQYGMGISQVYFSTDISVLSVSGGTKTIKVLTAQ